MPHESDRAELLAAMLTDLARLADWLETHPDEFDAINAGVDAVLIWRNRIVTGPAVVLPVDEDSPYVIVQARRPGGTPAW